MNLVQFKTMAEMNDALKNYCTDTKFLLIRDIIKSNLLAETKISLIHKMVSP